MTSKKILLQKISWTKTTKIEVITKTIFYNNKVTELILNYKKENNFNPFYFSNVQNLNLEFNLNDITIQT